MFIVQQATDQPIDWPVTVEYAAAGGKIAKHTFTGYFLLLDDAQREAILAGSVQAATLEPAAETDANVTVTAVHANAWKDEAVDAILKVMTDWKGVVDQDKNPIAFTRDNLRTAARSPQGVGLLRGINTAISEIVTGARAKN